MKCLDSPWDYICMVDYKSCLLTQAPYTTLLFAILLIAVTLDGKKIRFDGITIY